MEFFKSELCKNGSICTICRNPYAGDDFRIAIKNMFEDVNDENFECPHGISNNTITVEDVEKVDSNSNSKPKLKKKGGCKGCGKKSKKFKEALAKTIEKLQ